MGLKFFHRLALKSGDYPDSSLNHIIQSIVFRFPPSNFDAKGTERTKIVRMKLLEKKLIHLEEMLCPKIEDLIIDEETSICDCMLTIFFWSNFPTLLMHQLEAAGV